jgi:multiple sugar transport system substrate-binding protein
MKTKIAALTAVSALALPVAAQASKPAEPGKQGREKAAQKQAAKTFIDWITRNSASWAEAGQIPARATARESQEFQKLEAQKALAEQVPYLRFAAGVPGISDVRESTLDQAIAEAVSGTKSVRSALDESAKRATELLRLNREKYEAVA